MRLKADRPNSAEPNNQAAAGTGTGLTVLSIRTLVKIRPLSGSPAELEEPKVLLFTQKPNIPKLLAMSLESLVVWLSSSQPLAKLIELNKSRLSAPVRVIEKTPT